MKITLAKAQKLRKQLVTAIGRHSYSSRDWIEEISSSTTDPTRSIELAHAAQQSVINARKQLNAYIVDLTDLKAALFAANVASGASKLMDTIAQHKRGIVDFTAILDAVAYKKAIPIQDITEAALMNCPVDVTGRRSLEVFLSPPEVDLLETITELRRDLAAAEDALSHLNHTKTIELDFHPQTMELLGL